MTRIAVHSIMLDESEEFLERWAASAAEADLLMLADTGSTTNSVTIARDLGITVAPLSLRPFRFDHARNAGLAALSPDVDLVVKLDVDEVLTPGWRDALEAAVSADPDAVRFAYRYVWSHHPDGSEDVVFTTDHIHSRFGWFWRHPAHEALVRADGLGDHIPVYVPGLTIEHWPDSAKPRSQYLQLLKLAVEETPDDDRMAHYYARELYYAGHWDLARIAFTRHLGLLSARWPAERAASYRYLAIMDEFPERWLLHAVAEDPGRRESWVELADFYHRHQLTTPAAGAAARALMITERPEDYIASVDVWDDARLATLVEAGQETP